MRFARTLPGHANERSLSGLTNGGRPQLNVFLFSLPSLYVCSWIIARQCIIKSLIRFAFMFSRHSLLWIYAVSASRRPVEKLNIFFFFFVTAKLLIGVCVLSQPRIRLIASFRAFRWYSHTRKSPPYTDDIPLLTSVIAHYVVSGRLFFFFMKSVFKCRNLDKFALKISKKWDIFFGPL